MHTRRTMRAGPDDGERERGRPSDGPCRCRPQAPTLRGRPSATQVWRVRLDPQVCRKLVRGGRGTRSGVRAAGGTVPRARVRPSGACARRGRSSPRPASPLAIAGRIEYRAAVGVAPRAAARGSGRIYKKAMFCVSNFEMTSRFP